MSQPYVTLQGVATACHTHVIPRKQAQGLGSAVAAQAHIVQHTTACINCAHASTVRAKVRAHCARACDVRRPDNELEMREVETGSTYHRSFAASRGVEIRISIEQHTDTLRNHPHYKKVAHGKTHITKKWRM